MGKKIKLICIAGILAILVLFVLLTGNGKSSEQKKLTHDAIKEQNLKASKDKDSNDKKHNIKNHIEFNVINLFPNP